MTSSHLQRHHPHSQPPPRSSVLSTCHDWPVAQHAHGTLLGSLWPQPREGPSPSPPRVVEDLTWLDSPRRTRGHHHACFPLLNRGSGLIELDFLAQAHTHTHTHTHTRTRTHARTRIANIHTDKFKYITKQGSLTINHIGLTSIEVTGILIMSAGVVVVGRNDPFCLAVSSP